MPANPSPKSSNRKTWTMLKNLKPAFAATALILTACTPGATGGTATVKTICESLGEALPTRARTDTEQTQIEIAELYADYAQVCPEYRHLIPA